MSYKILEKLYEGVHSNIYKAIREDNNSFVIIKALKNKYPTNEEIERIEHEYNMLKNIELSSIIKCYEYTKINDKPAIVLETFEGDSLDNILKKHTLDLKDKLDISINIVKSLENLHNIKIIHKDIKPHNILANLKTKDIKIIDFGISKKIENNTEERVDDTVQGTLTYISPEQTGRINQTTDYRSDLYSFGVTLYKLFTGELPFYSDDPMELIHFHIALKPIEPYIKSSEVPKIISDIIMKLLSKNPDHRYQSAYGLRRDLEKIQQSINNGELKTFELGIYDELNKLKISDKLYEREEELNKLNQYFEDVIKGDNIIVSVKGEEGIGKTSLINNFIDNLEFNQTNTNTFHLLTNELDKSGQNKPNASLIGLFEQKVKSILTLSSNEIDKWKEKIKALPEISLKVISYFIKPFKELVETELNTEEISPDNFRNLLSFAFQDFVKLFSDNPLIIFIDNIQNIDSSSLLLLEQIMTDEELQKTMLIVTYSPNEIDNEHPFNNFCKNIERLLKELTLKPLSHKVINELLYDTFKDNSERIKQFSSVILNKTNGNPFFIRSFIQDCNKNNYIWFNNNSNKWDFDLTKMKDMPIADNVADLMSDKITELTPSEQHILKLASCIGKDFDLETVSVIAEKNITDTTQEIFPLISSGLIIPEENSYEKILTLLTSEQKTELNGNDVKLSFLHGDIQRASYKLLSDKEKQNYHYIIGDHYLNTLSQSQIEDRVFEVANHMNIGRDLIKDDDTIKTVIELNLIASEESKRAGDLEKALYYAEIAYGILPESFFESDHEFYFDVVKKYVHIKNDNRDFDGIDEILQNLLDKSKTIEDKLEIYDLMMGVEFARNKLDNVYYIGKKALEFVNIDLPEDEKVLSNEIERLKKEIDEKIGNRTPEEIANLPEMTETKWGKVLNIITKITLYCNRTKKQKLEQLCYLFQIEIILEYGTYKGFPLYLIKYSEFLLFYEKNKEQAYRLGVIAKSLVDKCDYEIKVNVYNEFIYYINTIKNSPRTNIKLYKELYNLALKNYDIEGAAIFLINISTKRIINGINLKEILTDIDKGKNLSKMSKTLMVEKLFILYQNVIFNLLGLTLSLKEFNCKEFSEVDYLKEMKNFKFIYNLLEFYKNKLSNLHIYEEYEELSTQITKLIVIETDINKDERLINKYQFLLETARFNENEANTNIETIENTFKELQKSFINDKE